MVVSANHKMIKVSRAQKAAIEGLYQTDPEGKGKRQFEEYVDLLLDIGRGVRSGKYLLT